MMRSVPGLDGIDTPPVEKMLLLHHPFHYGAERVVHVSGLLQLCPVGKISREQMQAFGEHLVPVGHFVRRIFVVQLMRRVLRVERLECPSYNLAEEGGIHDFISV